MTRLFLTAAVLCLFAAPSVVRADEGLCKGDSIGAFYVTKIAGAEDDGVSEGEDLCYRCKYGQRPMVMVFARSGGEKMTQLVQKLDAAIGSHEDADLKGLVTMVGGDASDLKAEAQTLATAASSQHVPIVVSKDPAGPKNYKLSDDVEITIVVASDSQVVARHEFKADSIDIAAVMTEVEQMLN